MSDRVEGVPAAVVAFAMDNGVHETCLRGKAADACSGCTVVIMAAFDSVYGTLPDAGAILLAILDDLAAEADDQALWRQFEAAEDAERENP
jgi:hypothetical protein